MMHTSMTAPEGAVTERGHGDEGEGRVRMAAIKSGPGMGARGCR